MTWQEACQRRKAAQFEQIPKEWYLTELPPASQLDVTAVPRTCGLLSPKELEITELDDVDKLLAKVAKGEWSAFEVTVRNIYHADPGFVC
jgi:amidase